MSKFAIPKPLPGQLERLRETPSGIEWMVVDRRDVRPGDKVRVDWTCPWVTVTEADMPEYYTSGAYWHTADRIVANAGGGPGAQARIEALEREVDRLRQALRASEFQLGEVNQQADAEHNHAQVWRDKYSEKLAEHERWVATLRQMLKALGKCACLDPDCCAKQAGRFLLENTNACDAQ